MDTTNKKPFRVTNDIVASLAQRFVNWLIDMIVQTILLLILFTIIVTIAHSYGNKTLASYLLLNPIGQFTFGAIIRLIYYIFLETLTARTLGKVITQTIVVDENGNPPTHEVILIRSLCRLIPFYEVSFFGIPPRGWHDSLSKTFVVDKRMLEEAKRKFYSLQETKTEK